MKRVNIRGTRRLLDAAGAAGVSKFFFLSSYEVYGKTGEGPHGGVCRGENEARDGVRRGQAQSRAPLHGTPTGPHGGDRCSGPRPSWAPARNPHHPHHPPSPALGVEEANRVYVAGHGENRFQLLHPDDAAEALMLACRSAVTAGKVYNLGSDDVPMQMEQMLEIKEKARLDAEIDTFRPRGRWLSASPGPSRSITLTRGHVLYLLANLILDCRAAKTDLGWEQRNVDILLETMRWYRARSCNPLPGP